MNKTFKKITDSKVASLGLIISGMLVAFAAVAVYSKTSQPSRSTELNQEQSYGPLGYGRGNGQKQMDWQGRNKKVGTNLQGKSTNTDNLTLNKQNCLMDGCLLVEDANYPVEELDVQTIKYLEMGLADERKALATYEATMEKFGNVRPFINIARAEEQHISMLKALFDKYGVAIPKDTTQVGKLPATLQEVCAVGVQAEIDNDKLYQDMMPNIKQEDIKTVFTSLANASKEMHLPAFERCAN